METEQSAGKGAIRKNVLYVIVGIIVVGIIIVVYFNPFQPTTDVRIMEFFRGGSGIVGDQTLFPFEIEIQNFGYNDVSGLVLVVKVLGDSIELGSELEHLSTLKAGYRVRINMTIWINTEDLAGRELRYDANVQIDSTILDESTLP